MFEGMPWPVEVGAAGLGWLLAGAFILLFYRGKVVPRSTLDDALHDRNEWRAETRIKDAQLAEKDEQLATKDRQLSHLSEVGATMRHVLSALQRLSGGAHEEAPR